MEELINPFQRRQDNFYLHDMFPKKEDSTCACGCNKLLRGRQKKWASMECADNAYTIFAIIKGNNGIIRKELFKLDEGHCRYCGMYDNKWQADHIIPVEFGGGGRDLSNFQTLCLECHQEKTNFQREFHLNMISSQETDKSFISFLYVPGAQLNSPLNMSIETQPLLSTCLDS